MSRKGIHITVPARLMERFEACLAYEGLNITSLLVSKIQAFCDQVEAKQSMIAGQAKHIEETIRQMPGNGEIAGRTVTEAEKSLLKEAPSSQMARSSPTDPQPSPQAPSIPQDLRNQLQLEVLLLKDLLKGIDGMPAVKGSLGLKMADLNAEVLDYHITNDEGQARLDYQLKEDMHLRSLRMERVNVSPETKALWIELAAQTHSVI